MGLFFLAIHKYVLEKEKKIVSGHTDPLVFQRMQADSENVYPPPVNDNLVCYLVFEYMSYHETSEVKMTKFTKQKQET